MKLLHKISHLLGWNTGLPESHYEGDALIMCFKCYGCGELQDCAPCDGVVDRALRDRKKITDTLYNQIIDNQSNSLHKIYDP